MHRDRLQFVPSTIIFRQTIITNPGKQGKCSPCLPALQNSKNNKSQPNVNKKPNIQANRYNQSGKTGKTVALFARFSKFQNCKFRPKHKQNPTTLGTNCSKSECTDTIKGPQDQKHKSSRFKK